MWILSGRFGSGDLLVRLAALDRWLRAVEDQVGGEMYLGALRGTLVYISR